MDKAHFFPPLPPRGALAAREFSEKKKASTSSPNVGTMFLLTRGVSERVWAEDPTVRFTLPQLQPELLCSDEDEDPAADVSHGKEENQWSGWVPYLFIKSKTFI